MKTAIFNENKYICNKNKRTILAKMPIEKQADCCHNENIKTG